MQTTIYSWIDMATTLSWLSAFTVNNGHGLHINCASTGVILMPLNDVCILKTVCSSRQCLNWFKTSIGIYDQGSLCVVMTHRCLNFDGGYAMAWMSNFLTNFSKYKNVIPMSTLMTIFHFLRRMNDDRQRQFLNFDVYWFLHSSRIYVAHHEGDISCRKLIFDIIFVIRYDDKK